MFVYIHVYLCTLYLYRYVHHKVDKCKLESYMYIVWYGACIPDCVYMQCTMYVFYVHVHVHYCCHNSFMVIFACLFIRTPCDESLMNLDYCDVVHCVYTVYLVCAHIRSVNPTKYPAVRVNPCMYTCTCIWV